MKRKASLISHSAGFGKSYSLHSQHNTIDPDEFSEYLYNNNLPHSGSSLVSYIPSGTAVINLLNPIEKKELEYFDRSALSSLRLQLNDLQNRLLMMQSELSNLSSINKQLLRSYFSQKLESNILKLQRISEYPANWNNDGSPKISASVIQMVSKLLFDKRLKIQPSVFPTLRNSIQLEFRILDIFIEVEVLEDHFEMIVEDESSKQIKNFENISWDKIVAKLSAISTSRGNRSFGISL